MTGTRRFSWVIPASILLAGVVAACGESAGGASGSPNDSLPGSVGSTTGVTTDQGAALAGGADASGAGTSAAGSMPSTITATTSAGTAAGGATNASDGNSAGGAAVGATTTSAAGGASSVTVGGATSTTANTADGGAAATVASTADGTAAGATSVGGAQADGGQVVAGGVAGNSASGGSANSDPSDPGAITAAEAAAAMGRGVNLGQMFDSTQHPRTLAAASAKIDAYYERGFRNLRIPVTWTEPVDGDLLVNDANVGDVNRDHPRLAVIQQVVDYALSKPGMYVVLNAHHEQALKTNSKSAVLERLWQDLAEIFGDREHRLLFEILNEPHREDTTPMPAADLRLMTGLAYQKIRAVDPNRIVLIGGNQWFGASEIPTVWTSLDEVGGGQDPYVMATFHHYDPWTFCGDDQGTYDDAWTEANISSPMDTMKTWADSVGNGMPVYIGEWGVAWGSRYGTLTCNNIRLWYESFDSQSAKPRGQPTAVWDDGGWFMVFSHATNSFANNLIDCIVGDCAWDGEERLNDGCL